MNKGFISLPVQAKKKILFLGCIDKFGLLSIPKDLKSLENLPFQSSISKRYTSPNGGLKLSFLPVSIHNTGASGSCSGNEWQ